MAQYNEFKSGDVNKSVVCPYIIKAEIRVMEWVLNTFCVTELRPQAREHLKTKIRNLKEEVDSYGKIN